jgi:hypothetical protein
MSLVGSQGGSNLPLESLDSPMLGERMLNCFESLANLFDQLGIAAEVDRMLAVVVAVGKSVVGTEAFAVSLSPRGGDVPLAAKDVGPSRNELHRGMGVGCCDGLLHELLVSAN